MSSIKDVCAVVVTYNPDNDIFENLQALSEQVGFIAIVDNNSENIDSLKLYCKNKENLLLIENKENLGIAKALNIGATYAMENNFMYLLTMDDDSKLLSNCVETMLDILENNTDNIVSCGPNYDNEDIGNYKICDVLISSGNLTKLSVYRDVGGFDDKLFIDCVDFDFSFKIRLLGYSVAKIGSAKMKHKLGNLISIKTIFGRKEVIEHSAFRYYYIYRNGKYLRKKYRKNFKFFCFKSWINSNLHILAILLFHNDKKAKFKAIRQGKKDSKLL